MAQQHAFEQQLWERCKPFLFKDVPQQTLCKRVESFLPELFVFVAVPGVPAHNNLAERSVRPLVIARKISGEPVVPKAHKHAWGSPVSLAPGWLKVSIRSPNASLSLLSYTPLVKSEQLRKKKVELQ